ncbi:3-hydroxylacyl-ACP dehydratase [Viridibacterium curvum]|uniref:3-hydroxylacyl-ACP dehydratase n=1 Tax=Viridibacterium curvum TaxID=1101404 RepID=A0ABP9R0E3_9RHOO
MTALAIDIAAHVPHAGDMCLLESVTHWDAQGLTAQTRQHRNPQMPLFSHARLGVACGVEIAAQGMALHGALLAGQSEAERPRAGFLASLRDVRFHVSRLDDIDAALQISVQRLSGDDNTVLYQFSVTGDGRPLLEGRAAVMLDAAKVNTP